jgi:hypothetical protein
VFLYCFFVLFVTVVFCLQAMVAGVEADMEEAELMGEATSAVSKV